MSLPFLHTPEQVCAQGQATSNKPLGPHSLTDTLTFPPLAVRETQANSHGAGNLGSVCVSLKSLGQATETVEFSKKRNLAITYWTAQSEAKHSKPSQSTPQGDSGEGINVVTIAATSTTASTGSWALQLDSIPLLALESGCCRRSLCHYQNEVFTGPASWHHQLSM